MVDGRTLRPLLAGATAPLHDAPICLEHEGNRMVRDGRWKLVGFFREPWELYDLETDRAEARNVAAAHPDIVRRLEAAYATWATRVGALPWDGPNTTRSTTPTRNTASGAKENDPASR